ncbi:MAG: hypothetical protein HQK95_03080 [Nitrospirae bacterium]|nr:hypothetical protein [Nitrospirota bacterium]
MTTHRKAMKYAEEAFYYKQKGDLERAKEFFLLAFELERKAAESYKDSTLEPTRSVLYRSAATLACDCGNLIEAERLAITALSGSPPEEIGEELKNLLKEIYIKCRLEQESGNSCGLITIAGRMAAAEKPEDKDRIDVA